MERVETRPDSRREKNLSPVDPAAMLHWRIYYADGRFVGSHQTTWADAPRKEIVAIVQAVGNEAPSVELGTPYYWHQGDWIARVWDATLYLRQTGLVKFGRWAQHAIFQGAWTDALRNLSDKQDLSKDQASLQCGLVNSTRRSQDGESGLGWALWYDDQRLVSSNDTQWEKAPSDGVMCAVYSVVHSGIVSSFAIRRFTYYYWRGQELMNTDDLEQVLDIFPQCKFGRTNFVGQSYLHQGQAIAAAFADTLEDVRK